MPPDAWLEEAIGNAERLAPVLDKDQLMTLLKLYEMTMDEKVREEIRKQVDQMIGLRMAKTRDFRHPVLAVPEPDIARGDITLGKVLWGDRELWDFGISLRELNRHMMIVALTGNGKTTLINNIIEQLLNRNIPFLITDYKKDYRHLVRRFPQLLVINWKDLRVNPLLPPPGVSWEEWKNRFELIFGHVEGAWMGSTQYMLQALDEVYEEKGEATTMKDVYNRVMDSMNEPNRKLSEYWGVVQTRLYGLVSKLGQTISGKETLDIARLLDEPVVLELDGLGNKEADFVVISLYFWIYAYRRAQNQRGGLRHVLIVDEAKHVFSRDDESQTTKEYSKIAPVDQICDEIRDFGEAIIAADQEPTKLSKSLRANTFTKLTGNLGDGTDVYEIASAMGLSDEEQKAIHTLGWGEWIVKLSDRHTRPFMLKSAERIPVVRDVTDEEIKSLMAERLKELTLRTRAEPEKVVEVGIGSVSPDASTLLKDVNENPFSKVRTRMERLGFSGRRMEHAGNELLRLGLAKVVKVAMAKGRPIQLFEITKAGQKLLSEQGMKVELWDRVGHVGLAHLYHQAHIAKAYRECGYEARLEAVEGERRFDVLAVKEEKRVGVEVEMSRNDIEGKLANAGMVDELVFVGMDEGILEYVRKAVQRKGAGNVRVRSIPELIRELMDSIGAGNAGTNAPARNKKGEAGDRNEPGAKGDET